MSVSNLNGAGWRLYRHINRYSKMSVLFGSNVAQMATAGQAQPVGFSHQPDNLDAAGAYGPTDGGDGLSRFEADFSGGETFAEPQTFAARAVSSPAGPAEFTQRAVQAVAPNQPNGPVTQNQPAPIYQNKPFQGPTQAAVSRSNEVARPTAPQASQVSPVSSVQRAQVFQPQQGQMTPPQPAIRPVNRNMVPTPAAERQPISSPIILPSQAPSIERQAEPYPSTVQPAHPVAPQINPMQPVTAGINRAVPTPVAHQAIQPAPAVQPPAPKVDRAQQERMGQMAVHNPEMVTVPKHLNATQVWNGLSRINQFHADREADEDTRSPWERKVVEPKKVRPKKLLRKTAIEEVGSTKKNRSKSAGKPQAVTQPVAQRDVAQNPAVAEVQDSVEPPSVEQQESTPASTANVDATPSLEDVWPVQRLDEPSEQSNPESFDPAFVNLDPPTRPVVNRQEQTEAAEVASVVNRVESAQQSDSSIDFVPPTRPRPQILRRPKPAKPVDRTQPEIGQASAEPVQREPYSVQTGFGELPSDLWNLVGDQPPAQSQPAVPAQRAIDSETASPTSDFLETPPAQPSEFAARSFEQLQPVDNQPELQASRSKMVEPQESPEPQNGQLSASPLAREALEVDEPSQAASPPIRAENGQTERHGQSESGSINQTVNEASLNRADATFERPTSDGAVSPVMRASTEQIESTNKFKTSPSEPAPFPMTQRAIESDLVGEVNNLTESPAPRVGQESQFADVQQPSLARETIEQVQTSSAESQTIQPKVAPTGVQRELTSGSVHLAADVPPISRVEVEPQPINTIEPVQPQKLAPASFRPVMRAEPDFAEIDDIQTDEVGSDVGSDSIEEASPEPEAFDSTTEPVTDLASNAELKGAMVFADPELAEADGGQAAPIEVSMPQLEQPATLFGDVEEVTQVAAEAEPKEAGQSVTLFGDEEQAAEKLDAPVPVSIIPEGDDGEPKQTYGDEGQVGAITAGGDSGEKEAGLTLYPDDDAVSGSAIELKIKVSGEEDLLIGFADSNQLGQFIDVAAAADQTPGLMLFPAEDGDGEGEFDPVPFLLQRQGEQELVIGFADEATLDAFLSEASEVERGPTALIYGEQEAADEDLENPAEVHFRSAEGNDVLLGYADTEALEELIQAADAVNAEHDLNELTQLVYGRLRHQLQVENERRGIQ